MGDLVVTLANYETVTSFGDTKGQLASLYTIIVLFLIVLCQAPILMENHLKLIIL